MRTPPPFKISPVKFTQGGFTYTTNQLTGYLNGVRIRRQFKNPEEAIAEKSRMELLAAPNGVFSSVVTSLTPAQVKEAESSFCRLTGYSLGYAVEWFLANYSPSNIPKTAAEALSEFLEDRKPFIAPPTYTRYKYILGKFADAFPERQIGEISLDEIKVYINRGPATKRYWNMLRCDLHAFFQFCMGAPRKYISENPAASLHKHKIRARLPEILHASVCRELFSFLQTFAGHRQKPGSLIPYFALCIFGGIRPSVGSGEIDRIGHLDAESLAKCIDLKRGIIRLGPEITKTADLRQLEIQPNLRAWLEHYPLSEYPITVPNLQRLVTEIKDRFKIGHDVLRHTFITMHVCAFRSVGDTSLQAGNSETIIKKRYLRVVDQSEALDFWSIKP